MNTNNQSIQRGQIWYAELIGTGSVQNSVHPIIIVSNELCNKNSSIITCIPLTSKTKRYLPTHIFINKTIGLNKDSIALCEQIQSIDKCQLKNYIGVQLNNYYMQQIEQGIMIQLGIKINTNDNYIKEINII